ncbi:hypothetical protein L2E82_49335 [Cichorium intybus]|uniref:Uncharacterized protein n=1 Tax=Cichorium intybus TaxID=13427 RepID=A0ACB8YZE5_CICIN|nr:hypothetical protein L2E82_49335 [Cichorium intybus]
MSIHDGTPSIWYLSFAMILIADKYERVKRHQERYIKLLKWQDFRYVQFKGTLMETKRRKRMKMVDPMLENGKRRCTRGRKRLKTNNILDNSGAHSARQLVALARVGERAVVKVDGGSVPIARGAGFLYKNEKWYILPFNQFYQTKRYAHPCGNLFLDTSLILAHSNTKQTLIFC